MTLLALALVAQGAPAYQNLVLPNGPSYSEAPEPPALLLFSRGEHTVCQSAKPKSPLADACALHRHLTTKALPPKKLQPLARRVVASLSGHRQALLRARLLAIKAQRSQPCLSQAGSGLFATAESRMILQRQRDALRAYIRALKSMQKDAAAALLGELISLLRLPYERLKATLPASIEADFEGRIEILPPLLISNLKRLARSLGQTLPKAALELISIETRRPSSTQRGRLWREDDELMLRSPGSLEPLRLKGGSAMQALEQRLRADDSDVATAAFLTGSFGFSQLFSRLVFLSELDEPELSRAGWIGRVALANAGDHEAVSKWLLKAKPSMDQNLNMALRRYSALAGKRIARILPSQWPLPILKAMISHSGRFDQRQWYSALLTHKDDTIKVLAHAAMRKTKPEAWLTAKLDKINACAADHLRLLMPVARPRKAATKAVEKPAQRDVLPEPEEVDDSAGSVVVPENSDPTED